MCLARAPFSYTGHVSARIHSWNCESSKVFAECSIIRNLILYSINVLAFFFHHFHRIKLVSWVKLMEIIVVIKNWILTEITTYLNELIYINYDIVCQLNNNVIQMNSKEKRIFFTFFYATNKLCIIILKTILYESMIMGMWKMSPMNLLRS